MDMEQLALQFDPAQEIHVSNPVIYNVFTAISIENMKKKPGMGNIFTKDPPNKNLDVI